MYVVYVCVWVCPYQFGVVFNSEEQAERSGYFDLVHLILIHKIHPRGDERSLIVSFEYGA